MARWLSSLGALGIFLASTWAHAQTVKPAESPSPDVQENFGIGAQIGFYTPTGLSLRAGARAASLEVAAGVMPTLLSYAEGPYDNKLKLLAPLELAPTLLVDVLETKDHMRGGLRFGYRYNFALGHGGTLGGQLGKRFGHWLLEGSWGICIYPKAEDNLRGDQVSQNASFKFPPFLNWGLNVSAFYFP